MYIGLSQRWGCILLHIAAKAVAGLIPQNGLGLGLQTAAKQSGRSFLHPAAATRSYGQRAVGPQPNRKASAGEYQNKPLLLRREVKA